MVRERFSDCEARLAVGLVGPGRGDRGVSGGRRGGWFGCRLGGWLDTPVAREVYGDAAVFVRRHDVAGTAEALKQFLLSRDSAAEWLARAPAGPQAITVEFRAMLPDGRPFGDVFPIRRGGWSTRQGLAETAPGGSSTSLSSPAETPGSTCLEAPRRS